MDETRFPEGTPLILRRFVEADLARNTAVLASTLTTDCVLRSPLTESFRFYGRHDVSQVFDAAFAVLPEFSMVTLTGSGATWAYVIAGTTANGRTFEEVQLISLDEDDQITEITMFGRPVPGLLDVMASIGGELEKRGVLPRGSGLAGGGVRPIGAIMAAVERRLLPRFAPAGND